MTFEAFLKHCFECVDFWNRFKRRKKRILYLTIFTIIITYFSTLIACAILGYVLREWWQLVKFHDDLRQYLILWARANLTRDASSEEVKTLQKHYLYPQDPDIVETEYMMYAPEWGLENCKIASGILSHLPILPKPRDPRLIQKLAEEQL